MEEDCRVLQDRVRAEGDKDLPQDALYIAATNNLVNKINQARLEDMEGELFKYVAVVS